MENNSNGGRNAGLTLTAMAFITFIVLLILKCCHVLNCNWFWVFFPLWLPFALEILIVIIAIPFILILGDDD